MQNASHQILKGLQLVVGTIVFFIGPRVSCGQVHEIPEHGLRVELPSGWQRIEALSGNTILKLARDVPSGDGARIVIATFLPESPIDVLATSRDDHIHALESGSLLGEKVTVIDVGRTQIAGIDALWGKTHRNLPSRGSTYEFTYEFNRTYKGVTKAFTIRLTTYGDERWFQHNSAALEAFIQSIRFSERPGEVPPISAQTQRVRQSDPSAPNVGETMPAHMQIEIKEGDPFWLALFKGYGQTFLLILLATIALGIGKWMWSKYFRTQK